LNMPWRSPFGAPPRALWKRQTVQPFTAGATQGFFVRFEVAEQRGSFGTDRPRSWGYVPLLRQAPPPRGDIGPADFGELIADETEKWGKVNKFAGIRPE
jgi:hypothetical protein